MFISILLSIISFIPPVNYEISLAGNFGEPRAHHFHGGIDIKTERVENKGRSINRFGICIKSCCRKIRLRKGNICEAS